MGQGHAGNRCGTEQSPLAAMASSRPPAPVRKGKQRAAAIRPPPSSCPFRGGSMFAGEDERDSRSSPAPPHTQKKPSLSPSVGPRRAFLPTVLALFGCPFWCLSSVLLGLNVLCAVSPRPAHHTEPLGVSASMQSRHLQSAQHLVVLPVLSLTWGIHLPPHHQFQRNVGMPTAGHCISA